MTPAIVPFAEGQKRLDWLALVAALKNGHQGPKAEINDLFLYSGADTLLSRSAWIDGMGLLTKTATVFPENPKFGQPMVGGGVMLFDDQNGQLAAVIDFHLITKWKTAGDSLMAALALASADARKILIVGAGTVGRSLVEAFGAGYPDANFTIWNRSLQINCHHGTRSLRKGLCSRGAAVPDSEICVRITRSKSLHQRPTHSTRPNN